MSDENETKKDVRTTPSLYDPKPLPLPLPLRAAPTQRPTYSNSHSTPTIAIRPMPLSINLAWLRLVHLFMPLQWSGTHRGADRAFTGPVATGSIPIFCSPVLKNERGMGVRMSEGMGVVR